MEYWKYDDDSKDRAKKLYDIAMAYVLAHYDVRKLNEEEFFFALEAAYRKFGELTGVFPRPF